MSIKVHVLGWRDGVGQQVDRIEQGFCELGHEVVTSPEDCDLLYVNDSTGYDKASAALFGGAIRAKGVFNVLDLAPHLGAAFPLARVKAQLSNAHAVTCISETVQRDIRARLGVEATVVYNPIRRVTRLPVPRGPALGGFLFVGRVNDPEKRSVLGATGLAILGFLWEDMVTVGREPPSYGGSYLGEVHDVDLNDCYNRASFLICPTRNAFLGLPILEAMACGCIPVVCNDLDVRQEFLPSSVFPEYDEVNPDAPSIARFVSRFMQDNDARAEFSARVYLHYQQHWAERLSPKGVAQAILDVYATL